MGMKTGWISEPLKVLGGDNPLPRVWETNEPHHLIINEKTEDHLDSVASYDGTGTWYISRDENGIALVLIHEKGRRIYIVAKEYCYGEGG